jgi:hypothetical protein
MTTFTSEDRVNAMKILEEAPYHPGYEDVVPNTQLELDFPNTEEQNSLLRKRIIELEKELKEYRVFTERYTNTAQGIINFIKQS